MLKWSVQISCFVLIFMFMLPNAVLAQESKCDGWGDVEFSDSDYDAFLRVCEFGYFRGNSFGNLRPDDSLTRVETAVIVNRIFQSTLDYDFVNDEVGFKDEFFNIDNEKDEYRWIYRAVKNVSAYEVNGFKVFGGYTDDTFRPLNNIKFIEFAKVVMMGFQETGDAEYVNYKFDFNKSPWYQDVYDLMINFDQASALIETEEGLATKTRNGSAQFDLDTSLTRRQAIVFLDSLIEQGYLRIDTRFTDSVNGFYFDHPESLSGVQNDTGVTFISSEGYKQRIGIQRLAAGLYTGSFDPAGYSVAIPKHLFGKISQVKRFESCDNQTLNCQIAYFFIRPKDASTYFLEVSYAQSRFSSAKKVIETIYQSFDLIEVPTEE